MLTFARALVLTLVLAAPASAATAPAIVTGSFSSGAIDSFSPDGTALGSFPPAATGLRVALGDVTGDGVDDVITAPRYNAAPEVKVYDGVGGSLVRDFLAYNAGYHGGVDVAAGDVTGDGRDDIVTAPRLGAPNVRVFDGVTGATVSSFLAYDSSYKGGVTVAAGDVDGDGKADVVTGTRAGAGFVKVFSGPTLIKAFFAYGPSFTGGVNVAAGDVDGDQHADVVTGPVAGAPAVNVLSGSTGAVLRSFLAFPASSTGGVDVAAGDLDGDGIADLVTGRGPGGSRVKAFSGATLATLASWAPYGGSIAGVSVTTGRLPA